MEAIPISTTPQKEKEYILVSDNKNYKVKIIIVSSNKNHPLIQSGIGTNQTLSKMDIKTLLNNVQQYFRYCFRPKRMKVVVYSNEPLDAIQNMVKNNFYFKKRKVLNSFTNKIKERLYNLTNENLFEENKHEIAYFNMENNTNTLLYLVFQILKNNQSKEIIQLLNNIFLSNADNTFGKKMGKYISSLSFEFQSTGAKQDILFVTFIKGRKKQY